MPDQSRLSIHHATLLQQCGMQEAAEVLERQGIRAISLWRDKVSEYGVRESAKLLADHGLTVSGLSWAGLVTSPDRLEAGQALGEVRRTLDEAAELGAPSIIFVAGGIDARAKDLRAARARGLERTAELVPYARNVGVKIALEPLHPMICATRSVISTLGIANDWCDALGAEDVVGIALDVYATWWDPDLEREIARAGRRICAFHVSDWLADTRDLRLDRGMMGDGLIDIPEIRCMVEATGFAGFVEVEIFSQRDWWQRDPDEVVRTVKDRFRTAV